MRTVVRGLLREVHVLFNGDIDANDDLKRREEELNESRQIRDKLLDSFKDGMANDREVAHFNQLSRRIRELEKGLNNTLVVDLIHPGEDGSVAVLKPVSIGNGLRQKETKSGDFFASGLFKRIVIGEFGIRVSVTDTDKANPFGLFLRRAIAGAFKSVVKSPIDDIGNVLVSSAATELSSDIQSAIKDKSDDKITIVGVSSVAKFVVGEGGAMELQNKDDKGIEFSADGKLALDLRFPGLVRTRRRPRRRSANTEKVFAMPDSPNGRVVIQLDSRPLDISMPSREQDTRT